MPGEAAETETADPQAAIRARFLEQGADPNVAKKALEDATSLSRGLWLSFLTFGTYLVITFAGVTHRDLLLEEPITLPVLNAPLPLVTFFWVAPILFVIFHLYLLLSLKLLADQVHAYLGQMEEVGLDGDAQDRARLQLPNFVIVQVLGGTSAHLGSWAGWLMRLTAWLTLAAGPIILLLFAQLMFLPYHGWWVTMAHRATVVVDIVLVWYFWRAITRPERGRFHFRAGIANVVVVAIAFFVLMYPGEKFYGAVPKQVFIETGTEGGPNGLGFAYNTLVLSGEKLVSEELFAELVKSNEEKRLESWEGERSVGQMLRSRDFRNADFSNMDIRKADFTQSQLIGAILDNASLDGATFNAAKLHGASIDRAALQGTSFSDAELYGATFFGAELQGASFTNAKAQVADFFYASLEGASFYAASLQGANFRGANLQGSSLAEANLQGASFVSASLKGADIRSASLQGADFGAGGLGDAQSNAINAILDGANLSGSEVYRNLGRPAFSGTDLSDLRTSMTKRGPHDAHYGLTAEVYESMEAEASDGVPDLYVRELERRLGLLRPIGDEKSNNIDWVRAMNYAGLQPNPNVRYIQELLSVACSPKGRPFVATGIIGNRFSWHYSDLKREALRLVNALLAGCPGSQGMSRKTVERLHELQEEFTLSSTTQEPPQGNPP